MVLHAADSLSKVFPELAGEMESAASGAVAGVEAAALQARIQAARQRLRTAQVSLLESLEQVSPGASPARAGLSSAANRPSPQTATPKTHASAGSPIATSVEAATAAAVAAAMPTLSMPSRAQRERPASGYTREAGTVKAVCNGLHPTDGDDERSDCSDEASSDGSDSDGDEGVDETAAAGSGTAKAAEQSEPGAEDAADDDDDAAQPVPPAESPSLNIGADRADARAKPEEGASQRGGGTPSHSLPPPRELYNFSMGAAASDDPLAEPPPPRMRTGYPMLHPPPVHLADHPAQPELLKPNPKLDQLVASLLSADAERLQNPALSLNRVACARCSTRWPRATHSPVRPPPRHRRRALTSLTGRDGGCVHAYMSSTQTHPPVPVPSLCRGVVSSALVAPPRGHLALRLPSPPAARVPPACWHTTPHFALSPLAPSRADDAFDAIDLPTNLFVRHDCLYRIVPSVDAPLGEAPSGAPATGTDGGSGASAVGAGELSGGAPSASASPRVRVGGGGGGGGGGGASGVGAPNGAASGTSSSRSNAAAVLDSKALAGAGAPPRRLYRPSAPLSRDTLSFESRFESGNLRRAVQVSATEYDLILRPDLNTRGHTQWFYFGFANATRGATYKFNILNCAKPDSLFNMGMQVAPHPHPPEAPAPSGSTRTLGQPLASSWPALGQPLASPGASCLSHAALTGQCSTRSPIALAIQPLVYSTQEAALRGTGWRRRGHDIAYYQNHIKRRSGYYYTLSFKARAAPPQHPPSSPPGATPSVLIPPIPPPRNPLESARTPPPPDRRSSR